MGFITPFVTPSPKSAGEMMQPMLMGKTHGAVYLVDLLSDDAHRFTDACFAGRHFGDETISA